MHTALARDLARQHLDPNVWKTYVVREQRIEDVCRSGIIRYGILLYLILLRGMPSQLHQTHGPVLPVTHGPAAGEAAFDAAIPDFREGYQTWPRYQRGA